MPKKLPPDIIERVIELRRGGMEQLTDIATRLSVSRQYVRGILRKHGLQDPAQRQVHRTGNRARRLAAGKAPKHPKEPEDVRAQRARLLLDQLLTMRWSDGTATRVGLAR